MLPRCIIWAFILFELIPHNGWSALPQDVQKVIEQLPGKTLSLPVVLSKALEVSDSFQAVRAEQDAIAVQRLRAEAPVDPRGFIRVSRLDDKRQPQIAAFQPKRTERSGLAFGVASKIATGTELSVEVSHGRTVQNFLSIPALRYFETIGSLSISQSLLKDAFGFGTQAGVESGAKAEEAAQAAYQESVEQWALGLIDLYYQSWLSMAQRRIAESALERRIRLEKITQIKLSRGTAERPDVIQVETAVKNSKIQLELSDQTLQDRWRALAVTLKLPSAWLTTVRPQDIPMALDEPFTHAKSECKKILESNASEIPASARLVHAQKISESLDLLLKKAKWNQYWDLSLKASVFANRIEGTLNDSISKWRQLQYPGYQIGLELQFPFFRDAEKAEFYQAFSQSSRASAELSQAYSFHRVEWINTCLEIERLERTRDLFQKALESEKRRVELENERFRLGRVGTLNVIQAEDDASNVELSLARTEVELRMTAWKVMRLSGKLKTHLESLPIVKVDL